MQIRVLGGNASSVAWSRSGCLLVDDVIAFDSGGLVSQLSLLEQAAIDHVLITHAHLDHIGELAFLADNVMSMRSAPLKVWAPDPVIDQIRRHLFNNQLWPDFSSFRVGDFPVVEFCPCNPGQTTTLAGLRIRCAPTNHPVCSVGYLVSASQGSFLYSGDTGPTDALWALAREAGNLRAVFVETTFPNRMQEIALASGHLTPALLGDELAKLGRSEVAINIMHVKAVYQAEIDCELLALKRPCTILTGGERFML